MKNIKNFIKRIIQDESGQGAVEYILLLVVVVAIALLFKGQIMGLVQQKMADIGADISAFK